ncbi:MAG: hypothetical protein KKF01_10245, partial [Proteobacteria bacterium]|nr:hypothetical protein [Pseudomonadota bacterium]
TAEASELVLTLTAIGDHERAAIVFNWICDKKFDDGSYWMGVTFPDGVIWPEEKTSWTAAVVLLAHDALREITPGSRLFCHDFWNGNGFVRGRTETSARRRTDSRKRSDFSAS